MKRTFLITFITTSLGFILNTGCQLLSHTQPAVPKQDTPPPTSRISPNEFMVIARITAQPPNLRVPWVFRDIQTRVGIALMIRRGHFLLPSSFIRYARHIELENIDASQKTTAHLLVDDKLANLAIVQAEDPNFISGKKPIAIASPLKRGSAIRTWQINDDKSTTAASGTVRKYIYNNFPLMQCEIDFDQFSDISPGLPVIYQDKLAGIIISADKESKRATAIPPETISHFLADADAPPYHGFPRLGFRALALKDRQLRRYLKLPPQSRNGIFISFIQPNSPAEKAGLKKNDVLLSLAQYPVDQDGNIDHPIYGKIDVAVPILLSTPKQKLSCTVWRDGKELKLTITPEPFAPQNYPIPMVSSDEPPPYFIIGGFVFQELSYAYLKQWNDWVNRAPPRLVYYARNQFKLLKPGQKLVFLSAIIPTPSTLGYEQFNFKILTHLNNKPIHSLKDILEALQNPVNKKNTLFHVFKFRYPPHEAVIEVSQATREWAVLQQRLR
ncbi:MAG: PDZ domain-containing protein, partial [Lentisphaerae bacterium]